jgi:GNAT superfamily N-acetyltransferase
MIRRATLEDAEPISTLFARAKDEMTYIPRIPDDVRPKLGGMYIARYEVWVREEDGRTVAFIGLGDDDMLEHIYVDPEFQSRGIGGELLAHAKRLRPDRLQLWVFQKNVGARRFYEREGFRLVKLTGGADNMEREPDALYEWTSDS